MNVRLSHRLFVAIVIACVVGLLASSSEARKIRTRHSVPKVSSKPTSTDDSDGLRSISLAEDSLQFCSRIVPAIRFYGFDKTITSNIESFFISNGLDEAIGEMEIVITYVDMKGRQLHKRKVSLECDLPSGETRRYDIKSWDTQKSFYYHKSVRPKRQATPFDVRIELYSVRCTPTYTS
ncbi:MAG: hypothetical protein K2H22_04360 [Muribaculaceae bacterium]|nr:hypothetical protein [Muribaculaceae bacterium]